MKITLKIHPHNQDEVTKMIEALITLNGGQAPQVVIAQPKAEQPKVAEVRIQPVKTQQPAQMKAVPPDPVIKEGAAALAAEIAKPAVEVKAPDGTVIVAETLRALVEEKIKAGFRDNVKAEVVRLGAKGVSTIKEENYIDFYTFLIGLKNE